MGRILAHGLGGRSDLPVPMYLAQYGAAVALIFSFAALRTFWRTPRLEHAGAGDGRTLPPPVQRLADAPATRAGLRVLGLFLAGITVAAAIGFVAVTYLAATRASQRFRRVRVADPAEERLDRRFVHTLLPIAVGYTLAHYFSLLVLEGQNGYIRASDPFGLGWDLFGTASWVQNPVAVTTTTTTIALVQVGAIMGVHLLGVVAADDRAMATFRGRDRLRGQYYLFATMVCYTVGGIALLVGA
jgi:hypothetical protein